MSEKKPVFDKDGWCYDLEDCPINKEVFVSIIDNDGINVVYTAYKRKDGRYSLMLSCISVYNEIINNNYVNSYQTVESKIYAWMNLKGPFPAKLP